MASKQPKSKKAALVPGTIIECKSGRFIAYYEHRTDIIANGENEKDAKKNLKKLYEAVMKHEVPKGTDTKSHSSPHSFKAKTFTAKVAYP